MNINNNIFDGLKYFIHSCFMNKKLIHNATYTLENKFLVKKSNDHT